jgi:hypothetical protein
MANIKWVRIWCSNIRISSILWVKISRWCLSNNRWASNSIPYQWQVNSLAWCSPNNNKTSQVWTWWCMPFKIHQLFSHRCRISKLCSNRVRLYLSKSFSNNKSKWCPYSLSKPYSNLFKIRLRQYSMSSKTKLFLIS